MIKIIMINIFYENIERKTARHTDCFVADFICFYRFKLKDKYLMSSVARTQFQMFQIQNFHQSIFRTSQLTTYKTTNCN